MANIPEAAWEAIDAPNVISELLFPIFQGAVFDYPFREVQPIIREYYERLGPKRLCWGSDLPNVERHATYRQSLAYLRDYCDFIPKTTWTPSSAGTSPRCSELDAGRQVQRESQGFLERVIGCGDGVEVGSAV